MLYGCKNIEIINKTLQKALRCCGFFINFSYDFWVPIHWYQMDHYRIFLGVCGSPRRKKFLVSTRILQGMGDGGFLLLVITRGSLQSVHYKLRISLKTKGILPLIKMPSEAAANGLLNENTKVFVHRVTCNGRKVTDRKVLYPFITVDGSNKAFYVYEGAIISLKFEE